MAAFVLSPETPEHVAVTPTSTSRARGRCARLTVATFECPAAPSGWHRFAGRWYVEDKLVLTSDTTIEFVEP